MDPIEYDALREVTETAIDREMEAIASLRADLHNAWMRDSRHRAYQPTDFYKPMRRRRGGQKERVLADPMDPFATQTVEEKKFAIRSMLMEAWEAKVAYDENLALLQGGGIVPVDEDPNAGFYLN